MEITRELVKDIPIFSNLTDEEFLELANMAEVIEVKAEDTLFRQKDKSEAFYIILQGSLEVLKDMKYGKTKKLADMGKGAVVGEMAFLAGTRRSATIRAIDDGILIKIKKEPFKASMRQGESLAGYKLIYFIARSLSEKLKLQVDKFQELSEKRQKNRKSGIFQYIFSK